MLTVPMRFLLRITHWHVDSQQMARRNALLASTELAERRRELVEVEEFLAARAAGPTTLEVPIAARG